jgi:hypothetical protein
MSTESDYWRECIAQSAEECGASLTPEQVERMADDVQTSHENYGMTFYSPSASDRVADVEREHVGRARKIEAEHDRQIEDLRRALKDAWDERNAVVYSLREQLRAALEGGR